MKERDLLDRLAAIREQIDLLYYYHMTEPCPDSAADSHAESLRLLQELELDITLKPVTF